MQIVLDGRCKTDSSVLALGMFDGVHIGHRVLLQRARKLADRSGVPLVVCTFVDHPLEMIAPQRAPKVLTTLQERAQKLEALGVDVFCAMPFDRELMDRLPEEYVGELVRRFHPTDVVCGYNHTFGKQGKGTPALLQVLGDALGFRTSVVPAITLRGAEVSSTAVRGHLAAGRVQRAAELLHAPYAQPMTLERDGVRCRLTLTQPKKQTVAPGRYRAVCDDGQHAYPMLINERGDGTATAVLPAAATLAHEVIVRYLSAAASQR